MNIHKAVALLVLLLAPVAAAQEPSPNEFPIAAFDFDPVDPQVDETIAFTSHAVDPDGEIVNWTWNFGDGAQAFGPVATHEYSAPGTYAVSLTVIDNAGAAVEFGREVTVYAASIPNWLAWSMPMLVSIILFGLAYLVVLKGQPNIYNRIFFLFYTTSALKSLSESLIVLLGDPDATFVRSLIMFNALTSFVLVPLFLWLVLVFPRPVTRWLHDGGRGVITILLAIPFVVLLFLKGLDVRSYAQITDIFNVYASIVALVSLGLLVYHAWETDSEEERRRIRLLAATFFLLVFSTLVLTGINIAYSQAILLGDEARAYQFLFLAAVFGLVVNPILEIIGAGLLMYAILRYQLLGIERFVFRVTRTTVVALLVPVVFVTLGNTLEEVLQSTILQGVEFAFLIAGFAAALLMIPIERLITFTLNRLFPGWGAHDEEQMSRRRVEIYEAQLRYSLLDGALKPKEIEILQRLAASLELSRDELGRVLNRFPKDRLSGVSPEMLVGNQPKPAAPASGA